MGLRTAFDSLNAREAFPCTRGDASSYCMAYSYQLCRLVGGRRWAGGLEVDEEEERRFLHWPFEALDWVACA